jgi:hypothetical protein
MIKAKRSTLKKVSGAALAAAAAGLFLTAGVGTAVAGEKDAVHCTGINSCKGTAECKTAKNECKGQNSCKGQGWVSAASEKECKDKGGKVAKPK